MPCLYHVMACTSNKCKLYMKKISIGYTLYMLWILHIYIVYILVTVTVAWHTHMKQGNIAGRSRTQNIACATTASIIPCFMDRNATSTIPHKYSTGSRRKDTFKLKCGCADGAGPNSRRGTHVYEINTWLWNFGRPQPRMGGLSVAKTEKLRRKSRSEASKRGWATKRARKWPSHGICVVYTWYIPRIYLVYPAWQ